jgi:DNA-binding transcriptional LysR family regulator
MELRHLRYFVGVARAGGFVKAAASLNVAQPALSRQILDLERELGVKLFERHRGGARLTREGQRFLVDARRILDQADRAVTRARASSKSAPASFNIGYGELLAYWPRVSEVLHRFRLMNPAMSLMATEMRRQDMQLGLREERLDVGIIGMVQWPPRGFDGMRMLHAVQTGVIIAAEHPLAAQKSVRLADLKGLRWFHLRPDSTWDLYPYVRDHLRKAGFAPNRRTARPPGYAFLPQIAAGEGWAFADEALARGLAGIAPSIAFRPLDDWAPEAWVVAIWRKGSSSGEVRSFAKIAEETLSIGR